jgi:MSHA biogenesis protein MshQ
MRRLIPLIMCLFGVTQASAANQCSAVFPDGVSTHSAGGNISFGENSQLIGSDDNRLATSTISKNAGSNKKTCNTADCLATGAPSNPASSVSFQTTASTVDITVGWKGTVVVGSGSTGNEFNDINPGGSGEATITFSNNHSEYFVNRLVMGYKNTLYLQAGSTYWINQLTLNSQTDIIVQGAGTALIYVNQNVIFPDKGLTNSPSKKNSGDASKLVMYVFADVTLNSTSTYSGSLYTKGNLTLISSSYIFGAASSANIQLNAGSTITYQSAEVADTDFGSICDSPPPSVLKPILDYRFDACSYDGIAGDVIDQTGSFNGGSNGVSASTNNTRISHSLDLSTDNISDWVDVPSSVVNGLNNFSVAVWFKTSVEKEQQKIFHALGNNPNDDELEISLYNSDYVYIKVRNKSQYLKSTIEFTDARWHHLVLTRVDENVCLFIDGAAQRCDSGVSGGELSVVNNDAVVMGQEQDEFGGGFSVEQNFVGYLDEFKIFDVKLSDNEINSIYQNELAGRNFDDSPRDALQCEYICESIPGKLNSVGIRIAHGGSSNQINTVTEALTIHTAWLNAGSPESGLINNGGYNVAESGSNSVDRIDFGGNDNSFTGTLPYPGISTVGNQSFSDFLVHTSGTLSLPAGDYTIYVESDDGFSFIMDTLSGDTVSFNKFVGTAGGFLGGLFGGLFGNTTPASTEGASNELRFEGTTGNERTGGSFTLTQDSVFEIAAIFFERTGGDFLEISIANGIPSANSNLIYEIMREGALNNKVKFGLCEATSKINHYRIEHDTQGFTCEAETVTIKACADANCESLYDQDTTITLSDSGLAGDGWSNGNEITIPASKAVSITLSVTEDTEDGSVSFSKTSANPNASLRCFSGSTETCEMTFSDDGFEIYGANIGDLLPDQLASKNFKNVNLRAVRSNSSDSGDSNVCEALLVGTQSVNLTYNCDSPAKCLTKLNMISIKGDGTGDNSGSIEVEFDEQGVARLNLLNYSDAGRITLSVEAEVNGVTITNSDNETVDVYPSYLKLTVGQSELLYENTTGEQNNYIAGETFALTIGAYGANNALLPNYQAENPQLQVTRIQPTSSGNDGRFKYSDDGVNTAQLAANFMTASGLTFSGGEHQYAAAYYDEVGRINIDIRDNYYLGNKVPSYGSLTLGDFYPAYFNVALSAPPPPSLANTCGVMSYIGENIGFENNPKLIITAYNALDEVTKNYSNNYWNYLPNKSKLKANLNFMDSSTYFSSVSGTASVIDVGDTLIAGNNDYDGSGTVTITNSMFRYNKIDPSDNKVFTAASPFDANISLTFNSNFFTSIFVDKNESADIICYQTSYNDKDCQGWDINGITGTQMRYGRFTLESTYGPESESLSVPIKAEYFDNNQWLINSEDSCSDINFLESAGQMILEPFGSTDITSDIDNITSDGSLLNGVSNDRADFLLLNRDKKRGAVKLQLSPVASDIIWPTYLNYDWNGDGFIDINDFPEATITFGQFRGNDRIIQWREVFN